MRVNAAINRGDELLLIEFDDRDGVHFNFSGAGLDAVGSIEVDLLNIQSVGIGLGHQRITLKLGLAVGFGEAVNDVLSGHGTRAAKDGCGDEAGDAFDGVAAPSESLSAIA
jgi:hypothetical protein